MKNETLEFCKGIIKSGVGSSMDTNPVANCNTYEVSCSNCPFGRVGNCGKVKSEHITIAKEYILVNTPKKFKSGDKVINNKLKDGWIDKAQFRLVTDYFVVDNEEVFGSSQSGDVRLILDGVETGWSDDDLELYGDDSIYNISKTHSVNEKSFREVIADIKEGEVWESKEKTIKLNSFNQLIIEVKKGFEGKITGTQRMALDLDRKYTLQRKQYTFIEAFKAYEEGNEIEDKHGCKFKKIDGIDSYKLKCDNCFTEKSDESDFWFGFEEIRDKWYINNKIKEK